MQKFTLDDLVKRYDVAKGSISGYIKEHRNEIDPQAQHIFYVSGKFSWMDETALEALDKLRGYRNEVTLLAEIEADEEKEELKRQIQNLQAALSGALLETKNAYKQLSEAQTMLLESSKNIQIEAAKAELAEGNLQDKEKKLLEAMETIGTLKAAVAANDEKQQHFVAELEASHEREAIAKKQEAEAMAAIKSKNFEIEMLKQEYEAKLAAEKSKSFWQRIFG
nr:unnamed protein product [uncultured bacterium]